MYHNKWFNDIKSLSEYTNYETEHITQVIPILTNQYTRGASITIPYKSEIIPYLDKISDNASAIGAVNTVTKLSDNTLVGENTDWLAIRDIIIKHLQEQEQEQEPEQVPEQETRARTRIYTRKKIRFSYRNGVVLLDQVVSPFKN